MASKSLIGAGAVLTAALIGSGVTYAVAGGGSERDSVELVDVSTTPSPSVTVEPSSEPAPEPETTTTTATVEPEPVDTSVAPEDNSEQPVQAPPGAGPEKGTTVSESEPQKTIEAPVVSAPVEPGAIGDQQMPDLSQPDPPPPPPAWHPLDDAPAPQP